MKRLYIETNHIVGLAFEQASHDPAILTTAAARGVEVAMPAVCLAEALKKVQNAGGQMKQFADAMQDTFASLAEDQAPASVRLKGHLMLAVLESGKLRDRRKARSNGVLAGLTGIRLVDFRLSSLIAATSAPLSEGGPIDNLILATIVDDATTNAADGEMAFFTRNVRDFPRAALENAGVARLAHSQAALRWL